MQIWEIILLRYCQNLNIFLHRINIEYLVFVVGILVQIAHEICFLATLLLNSLDANVQSNF